MKEKKYNIVTRLDNETIRKIDNLINENKYDSRSSFIRRAVLEYLDKLEQGIIDHLVNKHQDEEAFWNSTQLRTKGMKGGR